VFKEDSYVDAIGYLAIGAELSNGEAIENWRRHQKELEDAPVRIGNLTFTKDSITIHKEDPSNNDCSDACDIDIPGGDPDSVDETEEEENRIKDCYHCFYYGKKYDGCLRGNHAIKSIGCNEFKDKTSCLTCVHNDHEMIQDDDGELRVLCKLDDEYHSNTRACDNWEGGDV
jgi:hypothetical protein